MLVLFVSNRYTVEESRIKMNSHVDMLRCWKCRKCIANLDCLIKDQATELFEVSKIFGFFSKLLPIIQEYQM